jgi:hypothetical protein
MKTSTSDVPTTVLLHVARISQQHDQDMTAEDGSQRAACDGFSIIR